MIIISESPTAVAETIQMHLELSLQQASKELTSLRQTKQLRDFELNDSTVKPRPKVPR